MTESKLTNTTQIYTLSNRRIPVIEAAAVAADTSLAYAVSIPGTIVTEHLYMLITV